MMDCNERMEQIEKRMAALEAYLAHMQRTVIPMIERMASTAEDMPSNVTEVEKQRDVWANAEWDRRFIPGGALELMKSRPDLGSKEAVALMRGILMELKQP